MLPTEPKLQKRQTKIRYYQKLLECSESWTQIIMIFFLQFYSLKKSYRSNYQHSGSYVLLLVKRENILWFSFYLSNQYKFLIILELKIIDETNFACDLEHSELFEQLCYFLKERKGEGEEGEFTRPMLKTYSENYLFQL